MGYLTINETKKVLKYFDDGDLELVAKILKDSSFNVNPDEITSDEEIEKLENKFYSILASKIAEEDYELLVVDGEIDKDTLTNVIIATNNLPLIKKCIQNDKCKWSSSEIYNLVVATNDNNLMNDIVANYNKYNLQMTGLDELYLKKILLEAQGIKYDNDKHTDVDIIELIIETENKELIKHFVKGNNDFDKVKLIIATNDSDFIKECINDQGFGWMNWELKDLIIATNDPKYIEECINNKMVPDFEVELIVATKDEDYIKTLLQDEHRQNKVEILIKTKNVRLIEECIKNNEENNYGLSIFESELLMEQTGDLEFIIETLKKNNNNYSSSIFKYIESLMIETGDLEFIIKTLKENEQLDTNRIRNYLKDNIEYSMKKGSKDISYIKKCLIKMYSTNNEVIEYINFNLLDPKYIDKLGLDKINQISCYPDIQEQVLHLSDSQLQIFSDCIEHYDSERWTPLAQAFLSNSEQYGDLIENIIHTNEKKINFEKINTIIQDKNIFEIKTLDDVENFEKIRKEKCDEWIKSEDITEKKIAVLQKIFGQSLEYSETLIRKYGQDIENIQDCDYKDYIQSVKKILEIESPSILEQIYEQCQEVQNVDKIAIEEGLKGEYFKLYQGDLFSIEQGEKIEEGVYEAGTDFKMIITVLSACIDSEREIDNYKEDWNRPAIASQHFCASYIRNDMLGTASVHNICYRFFTNDK